MNDGVQNLQMFRIDEVKQEMTKMQLMMEK